MGFRPFCNDVNATSKIDGRNAAQLCVAIPTNRSSADVERNGKSHMDTAEEIEPAWSTSSSSPMLSDDSPNFFEYLQTDRFPAGDEENLLHSVNRSFCVVDGVRFLEESNAHIVSKASQELADVNASYKSEMAILKRDHEQRISELSSSLKKISKDFSDKASQMMQAQNNALIKKLETMLKDSIVKEGLEGELRRIQDAAQAKDREVDRLNCVIQEMERTIAKMLQVSLSETLKRELALFVQNLRQNSLTSEFTANDHCNLALLESACHSVDRATDRLAKYLNKHARPSELELPIRFLWSGDFSNLDNLKHIWGHWICEQMFQGFEHVFFGTEQEQTSLLDFQKHRVKCFQIFQQKKRVPSLLYFKECDLFGRFCARMFSLVFPPHLVEDARFRQVKMLGLLGDGGEASKLVLNFFDLAKAIYLLHKLSFSLDPPARILRMGYGEPYDKRYHDSVVIDADNDIKPTAVVLMLRPWFSSEKHRHQMPSILEEEFRLQ